MLFEESSFDSFDGAEEKARSAYDLYEKGNITKALSTLQQAIDINPANSTWHFNKALALDSLNMFEQAIEAYESALELNPDDTEILNSLAVDYTRAGFYDKALSVFEHTEQVDPMYEPSYCNRIIAYGELGKHDLAEQMFYMAQQINPDCPLCFYNIGNSFFVRGEYKKAIMCWEKAAELDNEHPQINYHMAQAWWLAGDMDKTKEYLLQELRLNPGNLGALFEYGLFLLSCGQYKQAGEKFGWILELNPSFAPATFYLGELALHQKEYESAMKLFSRAIRQESRMSGPYYRMAEDAMRREKPSEAKAYLVSEMKLTGQSPEVLVSMASMFISIDELEYATNCLMQAIDADHENADAYYFIGVINVLKGEFEDSLAFFEQAEKTGGNDFYVLRDTAAVHMRNGQKVLAADYLEKAKQAANAEQKSSLKALESALSRTKRRDKLTDIFATKQN